MGITVLNLFFKFASPINCGAWAMLGGLAVVPIVSLVTPRLARPKVDAIFSCYDESVTVAKKFYLKEEEGN